MKDLPALLEAPPAPKRFKVEAAIGEVRKGKPMPDAPDAKDARIAELESDSGAIIDRCAELNRERGKLLVERDRLAAELAAATQARDNAIQIADTWGRERDAAKSECERLKAPHAKDCAYLLNGKREGRWDCDCDASEVRRLEAAAGRMRALEDAAKLVEASRSFPPAWNALSLPDLIRALKEKKS